METPTTTHNNYPDEHRSVQFLRDQVARMNLQTPNSSRSSYNNAVAVFQTPISAVADNREELFLSSSFVVTPPRIETDRVEEDEGSSSGRKRRMTHHHQCPPPMLPESPELVGDHATMSSNVFERHIPIHSPIAGISNGTLNLNFIAKIQKVALQEEEAQQRRQDRERSTTASKRDYFSIANSFPDLEDEDDSSDSIATVNTTRRGLTRALKMRRQEKDEYGVMWTAGTLLS
mmetsp:Transcript_16247/g.30147  ORF Transcript_16247/g.30147 Transcript_16247/m.30147 type:complete len:232 (-) Transcript_16247:449-1144(-)